MRVGDHWQIFVPPELAYGQNVEQTPRIGPNEAAGIRDQADRCEIA